MTQSVKGKGGPCFFCQTEGTTMYCMSCRIAWYCGKSCQKKHWKRHREVCSAAVAAKTKETVEAVAVEAVATESPLPTIESFFKYRAERKVIYLIPKEPEDDGRACGPDIPYTLPDAATLSSWTLALEVSTSTTARELLETAAKRIGYTAPLQLRLWCETKQTADGPLSKYTQVDRTPTLYASMPKLHKRLSFHCIIIQ